MVSRVVITDFASKQIDKYIGYIMTEFRNEQAAKAVLQDAKDTKERLLNTADSLKYCDDPELRKLGYRTIHFARHRYFYVYSVREDTAFVEAEYHDLQDYENLFIQEVLQ